MASTISLESSGCFLDTRKLAAYCRCIFDPSYYDLLLIEFLCLCFPAAECINKSVLYWQISARLFS